jgi:Na+/H+-dicarboxylate symporter
MSSSSDLLHNAIVFGFAVIGTVGVPGVLLVFVQMMMGDAGRTNLRPRL